MPELPEVETVRKGLEKLVVGKTIQEVIVFWPRIIESPEVDVFQGQLAGQTIEGIERRGNSFPLWFPARRGGAFP